MNWMECYLTFEMSHLILWSLSNYDINSHHQNNVEQHAELEE